jgi:uncharacterized protein (TIGR02466 family)
MGSLNAFSVPIRIIDLKLNIDSLIEFCYEMKRKDEKGVQISNVGGWQSDDVFNETHTEFVKLKTEIENVVKIFHEEMDFHKTLEQKISEIWININQKGHFNEYHIHAGSILSGAFYLKEGKTQIVFRHPYSEINTYYWPTSITEKSNMYNASSLNIPPKPNLLLIFPSWLYHKVDMSKEDTDRISFSFNTVIQETKKGNG